MFIKNETEIHEIFLEVDSTTNQQLQIEFNLS